MHETFGNSYNTISLFYLLFPGGGGGDGAYYNCLYREAPPKKVLFSGFRYMKGFFIVEVYERDIFDFSLLKDQNEITDAFIDVRDKKTCFSYLFIL